MIYGGLGNQLFKYFASLNLANLHKTSLTLDLSWYSDSAQHKIATNRRLFELNEFPNIAVNLVISKSFKRFVFPALQKYLPVELQSSFGIVGDANYFQAKRFVFSQGNFENFEYLPDFKILRKALSVKKSTNSWLDNIHKVAQSEKPICIHVRMTDYRKFSSIYDVLTIDYYKRALTQVQSLIGQSPIWLFSDDPLGARSFLEGTIEIDRVIPLLSQVNAVKTLTAMSFCRGIITANSTFSWWAGLRGSIFESAEVVIQPRVYDAIVGDRHDLVVPLPNWHICDN